MTERSLPLLMLPGLLCDERLFTSQLNYFQRDRRVITGKVDAGDSIESIAQSVLRDAPERFVLAGFSLGGIIALDVIRQAPERVAQLVLMDTTADSEPEAYQPIRKKFIAMAQEHGTAAVVDLISKSFFPRYVAQARLQDAGLKAVIVAMAEQGGAETFILQSQALLDRQDSRAGLASITCPTLVLCGDEDVLCPPATHREIAASINDSTLTIIPNCGHMSTLEQPDAVNEAINQWLAE